MKYRETLQGRLSAWLAAALLFLCAAPISASAEGTAWVPVALEDLVPGEAVAVTITDAGRTFLLGSENGGDKAPKLRGVKPKNGVLTGIDGDCLWDVAQDGEDVVLRPLGGEGWLFTHNGNDGLRVGDGEDSRWTFSDGTLLHKASGRYLRADPESGIWRAKRAPGPGQVLKFWQQTDEIPETEATVPETEDWVPETEAPPKTETSQPGANASPAPSEEATIPAENDGFTSTRPTEGTAPGFGTGETEPDFWVPDSTEETWAELDAGISSEYQFYFGQLHAHTNISDGVGSVEEAFRYAAQVDGLDFFAVTDHSDSFDHTAEGKLGLDGRTISRDFAAGKAAAAAVTNENFVGIFGYEMSWPQGKYLGHIGTFAAPGWQNWKQAEFSTLESYYAALGRTPGAIGQFNHPGDFYGNFQNFTHYDAAWDESMTLLEVGGEGGFRAYGAYNQALDAGWHVAPTSSHNDHRGHFGDAAESRTVVLAKDLTEEALYEAMRARRVYASDDRDLEIDFRLNGKVMGSILGPTSRASAQVRLYDPSDSEIGQVEVIGPGGATLAVWTVEENRADLSIDLPSGHAYYYIRVIQPDGDIAVTAPVWVDSLQDLGIRSFTSDAVLPIQGREVNFSLTLFNDEAQAAAVESLRFLANGEEIFAVSKPGVIKARNTFTYTLPYTYDGVGAVEFTVQVKASIAGQTMAWESGLTLRYRSLEQTGDILVDGSHNNFGTGSLSRLAAIAAESDLEVKVVTGELPASGRLLLITAPGKKFEKGYAAQVSGFLQGGGTVVLCGHAGKSDAINDLLAGIGSTMRLGERMENFDHTCIYNEQDSLTASIQKKQFFHHAGGCAVESGQWLVKDPLSGKVLIAQETLGSGGTIVLAGSLFLSDKCMPVPANRWDPASANQSIWEALLGIQAPELGVSSIEEAREGHEGQVFRVRGYVTAGTSDPEKGFPGLLCIQDDSGGIPISGFTDPGIQVGAPVEVIGAWEIYQGNICLRLIRWESLEIDYYRYVPHTIPCHKAMDYDARGGRLMQVQGKVKSLEKGADGSVTRLTLKDGYGGTATVVIEQKNQLAKEIKKGRTVRAMGIGFLDGQGEPILRVRNPEEVVDVPPKTIVPDKANPKTGDPLLERIKCKLFSFAY